MNSGLAGAMSRGCTAVSSYAHVKRASDQVWWRWEGEVGVYGTNDSLNNVSVFHRFVN